MRSRVLLWFLPLAAACFLLAGSAPAIGQAQGWPIPSVKIGVGDWKAEFETLQQQVQEVASAGATISEEVAKVAESANGSRQEMLTLSQTLQRSNTVSKPQAQMLQQNLNRLPAPNPEDIRVISRRLASDRFRTFRP